MTPFEKTDSRFPWAGALATLLLSLVLPAAAQQAAQEEYDPGDGCVWKLSDGDNTVYLAGSVHLLRKSDYPLPATFDLAYADSRKVIFEIDMADMMGAALEMQRLGMYADGDLLKNHLDGKTIGRVVDYFQKRSVPIPEAALQNFKPGFLFLTISSVEVQAIGARPELGLEMKYFGKAKIDGKPTSGLETVAYQMSRFDEFTDEEIEKLINQTLDEIDTMPKVIDDIIKGWKSGDTEKLDKLLNEQMKEEERLRQVLLVERNKNWIPHIEKALGESENVMVIVGAAHLIGKDSVIDLLKKKGYTVERVKPGVAGLKKAA